MSQLRSFFLSFFLFTPVVVFALEGKLLQYAQYMGADCSPVPATNLIGKAPKDETADTIYGLIWDIKDFNNQSTPLISGTDLENYSRMFLQYTVTVARKDSGPDRLKLAKALEHNSSLISNNKPGAKLFYLLRIMAGLKKTRAEIETIKTTFNAVCKYKSINTLPYRLAYLSALEKFIKAVPLEKNELYIRQHELGRIYAEISVRLVENGAFEAADDALKSAAKRFGSSWKEIHSFLQDFIKQRYSLYTEVKELKSTWKENKKKARRWAILYLSIFRRYEEAIPAMKSSGDSTLQNLAILLRTKGGLIASAEILRQFAKNFDVQQATGLKLLALDLYERSSPRNDLPQAKELRQELNGLIDPLLSFKLNPEFAYRGLTLRIITEPRKSFVYLDYTLQAVPESLLISPCFLFGIKPGRHKITIAALGKQDINLRSVDTRHGLIIFGKHRQGRSTILSQAGRNLFLHQKIKVLGALHGQMTLFDGKVKPLHRRMGFATNKYPCVFTLILPRTLQLSALRVKLWDGDKRTYKYRLDISADGRVFKRVADKANGVPAGWQNVLFPLQKVRVIKLHCIYNSANHSFQVLEIEGYAIASPEQMEKPIVEDTQ